jgi:hypothetical protein
VPGEPTRHAVVLDVNIYLEVGALLGPPFTWDKFDELIARSGPNRQSGERQELDSLRLVAACTSGKFAGDEPLEVFTNSHIDRLVRRKAMHPAVPVSVSGSRRRGLGWKADDAQGLVDDLIYGLVEMSNGGTLGEAPGTDGYPPLDHEDGMVYGACRVLAGQDLLCKVYCVTRDNGFLDAARSGRLSGHSKVVTPAAMTELIRRARLNVSLGKMRPSP